MPEAPNNSPFSRASRGSSFAPSTTHPLRAPLLTDDADLNMGHQGHNPSYLTAPTIFFNTTAPNSNHGDVQVYTDHQIFWPSDGPAMYLAPPMPATIPGSMQSNTHNHPNTDIYQFPTNLAPESYFGSFDNVDHASVGVGSPNPGPGSMLQMQGDISEPRYVISLEIASGQSRQTSRQIGSYCTWPGCTYTQPFRRPGDLARHRRTIHENPQAYQCPECRQRFNRNDNMLEHWRRAHHCSDLATRRH